MGSHLALTGLTLALCLHLAAAAGAKCAPPRLPIPTTAPTSWCAITANISLGPSCDANVTEIISVPWTTDPMRRVLFKQTNQRIANVRLHRLGRKVPFLLREGNNGQTITVEFRPLPAVQGDAFRLDYTLVDGVLFWRACATDKGFAERAGQNRAALWRPGGLTAKKFNEFAAVFSFAGGRPKELETTVRPPAKGGGLKLENVRTPEKALFVARWSGGACMQSRDCAGAAAAEALTLQAKPSAAGRATEIAVAGAVIGFLCLFIAGVVVMCLRRRKRKESEEGAAAAASPNAGGDQGGDGFQGEGDEFEAADGDIPDGFRHFAYDTDDPASGRMWRAGEAGEAPTSVSRLESVFVKDIAEGAMGEGKPKKAKKKKGKKGKKEKEGDGEGDAEGDAAEGDA